MRLGSIYLYQFFRNDCNINVDKPYRSYLISVLRVKHIDGAWCYFINFIRSVLGCPPVDGVVLLNHNQIIEIFCAEYPYRTFEMRQISDPTGGFGV